MATPFLGCLCLQGRWSWNGMNAFFMFAHCLWCGERAQYEENNPQKSGNSKSDGSVNTQNQTMRHLSMISSGLPSPWCSYIAHIYPFSYMIFFVCIQIVYSPRFRCGSFFYSMDMRWIPIKPSELYLGYVLDARYLIKLTSLLSDRRVCTGVINTLWFLWCCTPQ